MKRNIKNPSREKEKARKIRNNSLTNKKFKKHQKARERVRNRRNNKRLCQRKKLSLSNQIMMSTLAI
jgi:hypothetical protein